MTATGEIPANGTAAHVDVDDEEEVDESSREKPDVSHVAPPPEHLPPRDEAIELLSRRLDVLAARADRQDRTIESLAPARLAEMPTRAELRAIESLEATSRTRGEALERKLVEVQALESAFRDARAADRAAVTELAATFDRLETKLRDVREDLDDLRLSRDAMKDAMTELRQSLLDRDALRAAEQSRQLAGAYTLAVVALLTGVVTLVLSLTR